MVKVSIEIEELHPAIVSALGETVNADKVLIAVNDIVGPASKAEVTETTGSVRTKEGKKEISVSASGKISGIKLPKDSPAATLARIHWYLSGSREYYVRIDQVELPYSVKEWVNGKQFAKVSAAKPEPQKA